MSGPVPDLEIFRSRIAAELDRLRLWAEELPLTDQTPEAMPLAGVSAPILETLPRDADETVSRLDPLTAPLSDLSLGTAWLADLATTPVAVPAATFAQTPDPLVPPRDDTRLDAEIAALIDSAPSGLGAPGATGTMVILNAAFIPGWPFPDALVRDRFPAKRAEPALAALGEGYAAMSEAERAEYLARLGIPFQLPGHLKTLLDRVLDPKMPRGLLLAFLEALAVLADGLKSFEAELTAHRAARERLLAAMPRHPGGKTRLQV